MRGSALTSVAVLLFGLCPAAAQETDGRIFDNVVRVLEERYFDEQFRTQRLPALVERYRERANKAESLREQREVTHALLSHLPATHLGLISRVSYERLIGELKNELRATFGFELIEYDGKHYAHNVLEGGPAQEAGLHRGDRILTIDDELVDESKRLDWRSDDACLPDPAVRALLCKNGDAVHLEIARGWSEFLEIEIEARPYSMYEAAKNSARIIEHEGKRIGYVHFWMIHIRGVGSLLKDKLEGDFADCDALVLDLRGRGGSGGAVQFLIRVLDGSESTWRKPVVAIIDRHSRSAKEVIAHELRTRNIARLVGQTTAGAVIPASFEDVGPETVLMFPSFRLGRYTDELEGVGVRPDVVVEDARPGSGEGDPLLVAGVREAARLASEVETGRDARDERPSASTGKDKARKSTSNEELPSAREILGKMVKALGGEKAIRKHTTRTMTGKLDVGGMMQGTLEIRAAKPNFFTMTMTLEGMGEIRTGYDGRTAWRVDPMHGAGILEGEELASMLRQADFYSSLHYERNSRSIEVTGRAEFEGQDCYELKIADKSGEVRSLFIDSQSFLVAGTRSVRDFPMIGKAQITITQSEYKEFDGVKIPTRSKQRIADVQEITTTIESVSFEPIPRSLFDVPEKLITPARPTDDSGDEPKKKVVGGVTVLSKSLEPLRIHFNANKNKHRFIAILSPT